MCSMGSPATSLRLWRSCRALQQRSCAQTSDTSPPLVSALRASHDAMARGGLPESLLSRARTQEVAMPMVQYAWGTIRRVWRRSCILTKPCLQLW